MRATVILFQNINYNTLGTVLIAVRLYVID